MSDHADHAVGDAALVDRFLTTGPWAIVGASRDPDKFGNKVLRAYLDHGYRVDIVHPKEDEIEGVKCSRSLDDIEPNPKSLSIVTPPSLALHWVREAKRLGIEQLWFQPGASSSEAIEEAQSSGLGVLANGPCILVEFRKR